MFPIPQCVFLTRGVGAHRHRLTAFEYALRDADIEQQNLVAVPSILPAGCDLAPVEKGVATFQPGEITFTMLARAAAQGATGGEWTCAIAAAVFRFVKLDGSP